MRQIEISNEFKQALDLIENSDRHLLIFGKAGTGKSTFLNYCRDNIKKNIVVLAPTGVAAINVGGMTIHSFFGFSIDITLEKVKRISKKNRIKKVLKSLHTIIVDEISMVRADLLDCMNRFLQLNGTDAKKPFGGVQMVFIGDLYQIPPVVKKEVAHFFENFYSSPYFFSAKIFEENRSKFEFIEFKKIYRQKEEDFVELLNAVRTKTITEQQLQVLNKRFDPSFEAKDKDFWVYITGTNDAVKKINDAKLNCISAKEDAFCAVVSGEVKKEYFPADEELKLKVGSQVMLVNNDSKWQWVNGSIGHIKNFVRVGKKDTTGIDIELSNRERVTVYPHTWDVFKYEVNAETNALTTIKTGSFTQYPLRLAWAITVHKSQGKTFDNVVVDLATTFTPGQMYVALSRCVSLNGLVLKKKVTGKNIYVDTRITEFLDELYKEKFAGKMPLDSKIAIIKSAIMQENTVEITYLKAEEETVKNIIKPSYIGEMNYQNRKIIGVEGFCDVKKEMRCFRVDKLLEVRMLE